MKIKFKNGKFFSTKTSGFRCRLEFEYLKFRAMND
jgi:hypothetical protein